MIHLFMIINNILNYIFTSTANISVLRILNERVAGISGRETARLAGINLRSAQIALTNLENLKVVKRQVGGREHLFTLNRDHFLTNEIISNLFSAEQKFKTSLYKNISVKLKDITDSVILFGSVARKEENIESDLDICIVYSKKKNVIEKINNKLRDDISDKYGVTLAPFYITKKEFKERAKKNKAPINKILKEGKVLSGLSINTLKNG